MRKDNNLHDSFSTVEEIFQEKRVVFLNDTENFSTADEEYGSITARSSEIAYRQILSLYLKNPKKPIYLFIVNNLGGDFYGMLAIFELISEIKKVTPVYTVVSGFAYSSAAFLFLSGTERLISPESRLMFHYGEMFVQGNPETTRRWYIESEKIKQLQEKMLLSYYKGGKNLKVKKKHISNILSNDTVFTGLEAVKLGFATRTLNFDDLLNIGGKGEKNKKTTRKKRKKQKRVVAKGKNSFKRFKK